MIIKPTQQQLSKLYPNLNIDYLSDHIDRKISLINAEQEIIEQIKKLYNDYEVYLLGIENLPVQNKDKLIKQYEDALELQVKAIQIDGMTQIYELSSMTYKWLIEKYFGEKPINETGGESISKRVKYKRTYNLKNDVSNLIRNTLDKQSQSVINQLSGNNYTLTDKTQRQARQRVEQTEYTLQYLSDKAEHQNIEYDTDKYKLVYYRVEVLDNNICLSCMSYDGQFSETPLGLLHRNCRGIDIPLFQDLETGKYYDTSYHGYGHKIRTRTFENKFDKLSNRQKRRLLGKKNFELYSTGELTANQFLSNGRQLTNSEAKLLTQTKQIKKEINTIQKANKLVNEIDKMIPKEISAMTKQELDIYEKTLSIQKQIYSNLPKKAFPKTKTLEDYISNIDAKYDAIQQRRNTLK